MEITREIKYKELYQIPIGTCFVIKNDEDNDNLYIKTNKLFKDEGRLSCFERIDCVNLKDGTVEDFPTETKVIPYYDTEIIIRG